MNWYLSVSGVKASWTASIKSKYSESVLFLYFLN
jgi:hypothetical protein